MTAQAAVLRDTPVTHRYAVSEVFGPVCQGEGMLIGKPTVFVRLGGCDYRCTWCDSMFSVLPQHRKEWSKLNAEQICTVVMACLPVGATAGHVTLSGGNPAIHPLGELIDALHTFSLRVAIETQGSTPVPGWVATLDDVTLSPKPPSSGNVTPFDRDAPLWGWVTAAREASRAVVLKVVAFDEADYQYARSVHLAYPGVPFALQAGTLVGVATRDDLCEALIGWQDRVLGDPAMQDVAVLPQLHAVLKGHARGI